MSKRAMIVVGGGSSERFGSDKLLADLGGRPLIAVTVSAVADHVDRCVVVVREDLLDTVSSLGLPAACVKGGATRTLSEMAGLAAIGEEVDLIAIHDAARPNPTSSLIESVFEAALEGGGAVPVVASEELLLKRATHRPAPDYKRAQTPQAFSAQALLAAYAEAARAGFNGHDTAEVIQAFSDVEIAAVPGDPANLKVTYPEDLARLRALPDVSGT